MKQRAFTLIELLVVIAVISILAALLFPVFLSVRGRARQTVCVSNLRQIGLAMTQYAQDSDEFYPYGCDPSDNTGIWDNKGLTATTSAMPLLNNILDPYIKSKDVWRCPADTGYDVLDMASGPGGTPIVMNAHPSAYQKFGTSYLFRTELALDHKMYATVTAYDFANNEHGSSEVNVVMDGHGSWHGGRDYSQKRYDVLMGDGHVVNQDISHFMQSWNLQLNPVPQSSPAP